jgi:pectate lyase
MYSYTADSPEIAHNNVVAYAGRLQGGDFKWTFDNAVDDTSASVNKKLQDALKAYKGGNGEVMEYSSSSSSVVIQSSSSSVILSSSSEGSSNSSSSKVVEPSSSSGKQQGLVEFAYPMGDVYYDSRSANLILGTDRVTKLKIIGINGRRIDIPALKKMGGVHVLNLSALRAGIYIVRFSTGSGTSTMKIVKN